MISPGFDPEPSLDPPQARLPEVLEASFSPFSGPRGTNSHPEKLTKDPNHYFCRHSTKVQPQNLKRLREELSFHWG